MTKRQSIKTRLEDDPAISPKMTLTEIKKAALCWQLDIAGTLHDGPDTIVLLAPAEPGFWNHFTSSREYNDSQPDPMDRWSASVVNALADRFGGTAILPSNGPPFAPFFDWAIASGKAWKSPVSLLVHDTMGLWISFRGALRLPGHLSLEASKAAPCITCDAPCLKACPVSAFSASMYDVPICINQLNTTDKADCMAEGCAARRSCPVSQSYGRMTAQSAFHMKAFNPQ